MSLNWLNYLYSITERKWILFRMRDDMCLKPMCGRGGTMTEYYFTDLWWGTFFINLITRSLDRIRQSFNVYVSRFKNDKILHRRHSLCGLRSFAISSARTFLTGVEGITPNLISKRLQHALNTRCLFMSVKGKLRFMIDIIYHFKLPYFVSGKKIYCVRKT